MTTILRTPGNTRAASLLVLSLLASCGGDMVVDLSESESKIVTLFVGQSITIGSSDIVLTFVRAGPDTRVFVCPNIWTGDAMAFISLRKGGQYSSEVWLHTGAQPRATTYLGCQVKLRDLEPRPVDERPLNPDGYTAILELCDLPGR
jgi:hypothetical protein